MSLRNLQISPEVISNLKVPQIIDITDRLPVNPKYTWDRLCGGPRAAEKLTTIVLHHDAWPKKHRAGKDDISFAAEIALDHIASKKNEPGGDAGFPYHLWIRNGRIYQTNDLLTYTYGVSNNNPYTIHICVSGDYHQYDQLTDPDRKALVAAVMAVKAAVPTAKQVRGHGEIVNSATVKKTNCPGYDENVIRSDIAGLEVQLQYLNSEANRQAVAYAIAQEVLFLYNLAQGKQPDGSPASAGQRAWGTDMLMKLKPFMDQHKLLG